MKDVGNETKSAVHTHLATCPLDCPDACGMQVEVDGQGQLLSIKGNRNHPHSRGTLCGKTALYGDLVVGQERLLYPLMRVEGELQRCTWTQALERIVESVSPLRGEEIVAAPYAGSMGQISRRFPFRVMNALGATLTDGGLCDSTGSAGFESVLGRIVGPDLDDIEDSDLVVIWGSDLSRTVQHLQPAMKRMSKRGVPMIAVDVYRTETVRRVQQSGGLGLILKPGTDAALALALARLLFERDALDREWLQRECTGAEEFEKHVMSGHELAWAAQVCGLEAADIERAAQLLISAQLPFIKTGVGFARRRQGGNAMRAVCSMATVLGVPERLHFESDQTFELDTTFLEGPELRAPEDERPPLVHVRLGHELSEPHVRALFVWGHNLAVTCPDSARVRRALARPDLFLVVHEQFLTETAQLADVVLPAAMFPEYEDVYKSYGHRYLQWSRPGLQPAGEALSNVNAFAAIAKALGLPRETWDVTEAELCAELFRRSSDRLRAGDFERLEQGEPVKIIPPTGDWGTASGKPELASDAADAIGQPRCASFTEERAEEGAYRLILAPSRHTHNSTFLHSSRHVARMGKPTVFVNAEDARSCKLDPGRRVVLSNQHGRITVYWESSEDMPKGVLRVDGVARAEDIPEGVGYNALVSPAVSDWGDGNVLYSTRVALEVATT